MFVVYCLLFVVPYNIRDQPSNPHFLAKFTNYHSCVYIHIHSVHIADIIEHHAIRIHTIVEALQLCVYSVYSV